MAANMSSSADGISFSGSSSPEGWEMQERSSSEAEQGRRLLPNNDDSHETIKDEKEYKIKWRLPTGWVIFLSIITAILAFFAMILFTRYYIVHKTAQELEAGLKIDFQRSPSEYILDPAWDFDASRKTRTYKWAILDRVLNPDGVYRPMITIDGQFPGPLIECNEGDTLVIEVDNQSRNVGMNLPI
jgi:hypothetical protein